MKSIELNKVREYVERNIGTFHAKRLQSLETLKLNQILKRKNPYLFKAKNVLTAHDLVKNLLDAFLSSQEETIFGEFLEGLAVYICQKVYRGRKSAAEGIDLEFERDNTKYIVSIKSGPNWGNSSQIARMKDNFRKAKRILGAGSSRPHIIAINGCCYGRDNRDYGDYVKMCGQKFWEFISSNTNLYVEIIEPLGRKAKERNDEFNEKYAQLINKFTMDFTKGFCVEGKIDWERLVRFNSSIKKPKET